MPSGTYPFVLVVYTVLQLIFPLRTRVPMWKSMWAVITSPSTSPSFYHGYVGDIFTSMVKVFQDIAWTTCFVASGDWLISEDLKEASRHQWSRTFWYKNVLIPILCLLPLLFRFNQCLRKFHDTGKRWPHLANATKYALSQTVTLFGAFHPLYMMHRNPDRNRTNWCVRRISSYVSLRHFFCALSLFAYLFFLLHYFLGFKFFGWQCLLHPRFIPSPGMSSWIGVWGSLNIKCSVRG